VAIKSFQRANLTQVRPFFLITVMPKLAQSAIIQDKVEISDSDEEDLD
jgi:hypothetical protein